MGNTVSKKLWEVKQGCAWICGGIIVAFAGRLIYDKRRSFPDDSE